MKGIGATNPILEQLLGKLDGIKSDAKKLSGGGGLTPDTKKDSGGTSFADELQRGLKDINTKQVTADRMATELASGKTGNIHETMLAATQAELSFNLMVQVRNKALEAYSEIMRIQA